MAEAESHGPARHRNWRMLFSAGHRVFFLSAGLYAIFAMLVWMVWLGVHAAGGMVSAMPFAPPPHLWHAHEMVFGYPAAAIGGFFLTAVPNWTGARAARHVFIATAAGLWLAGRVAVWFSGDLPAPLVAAVDLAFLPLLAAKIVTQLMRRPKPQNLMFLGVLALIWAGNLLVHLDWMGLAGTGDTGLRAGLFATCALIAVLGGRVAPAFTRNAMLRAGRETRLPTGHAALDAAGIALALALPAMVLAGLGPQVTGAVAIGAGAAALARLVLWRPGWTLRQPILWALHLAYLALGLGLILTGLAGLGIGSEVAGLHVLGIGAIGGMTLAVMSRAALGHGGWPLVAPGPVAAAYGLVALAALARWAGSSLGLGNYFAGVLVAGGLWILAFTLYTATLWPVFWGARPEAGDDA
ncbi:MAG: NnrS family protein [Gemmobacter sp.]